jgi:ABC-type sugar transport system permease subunit
VLLVSGTNGKTTTSHLLVHILEHAGQRVVSNRSGANLHQALATTLLAEAGLNGRLRPCGAVGVFEVDEAALGSVADSVSVSQLILLNLFRDQLDRFGETDAIIRSWETVCAGLPDTAVVVSCADDPRLAHLVSSRSGPTIEFGLSEPPVHFLYSAWGVILAEVTVYTPFVLRPLLAAFSLVDQSQIEVAGLLGAKPWRIVRSVILPAALPAAIAGGSLCLLLTVNEFGIVLFIGAKGVITLPLLIYDRAIQESDYQAACAIALVNIALSLGLFSLYRFAARRLGG